MDIETLAYLAGAMDSDGFLTIKKSTYHRRVRMDAHNAVYSERMGLKQITPDIPHLLRDTFGGSLRLNKGGTENSRPLWGWEVTNLSAAEACRRLLPYLRVKRQQADILLELRTSKQGFYEQAAYWFVLENPDWASGPLVTTTDAAKMLGHKDFRSTSQAISNGTLIALPYNHGGREVPRVPLALIELVKAQSGKDGRAQVQAPQLIAWKERLFRQVQELNKIGINGTPIYHRTGPYLPIP